MIFNLTIQGEAVVVTVLWKGKDGGVEQYNQTILPGDNFSGIPHELLRIHAEKRGGLK